MTESILSFNKTTGYYEGTILVQVDAEIFRRMLMKAIEEDNTADLTDPQTWIAAIARVGKITNWLDKPHVKITTLAATKSAPPRAQSCAIRCKAKKNCPADRATFTGKCPECRASPMGRCMSDTHRGYVPACKGQSGHWSLTLRRKTFPQAITRGMATWGVHTLS